MKRSKRAKRYLAGFLAAALFMTMPGMDGLRVSAELERTQEETDLSALAEKIHSLYAGIDLKKAGETEFGTKNLIVSTDQEEFDLLGAEEKISLGNGLYVLSYSDIESAKKAHSVYLEMEGIKFAEADVVVKAQTEAKEIESEEDTKEMKKEQVSKEEAAETVPEENLKSESTESISEDSSVRIAVLDTGVKTDIRNLAAYIQETGINVSGSGEAGNTMDDNGHGSAMAQVITSALEENGKSSDCVKILPVKVLDHQGYGTVLTTYLGMKAAMEQGADIICLGLSGKGESKLLEQMIHEAYGAGITVIGAAGNDASDVSEYVPGRYEKTVIISNAKNQEEAAEDSNHGSTVDFSAYGTKEVLSLSGEKQTVSGTSMACAYVTGVAASFEKGLSCEALEERLLKKASPVKDERLFPYLGKGMIGNVPTVGTDSSEESQTVSEEETEEDKPEEDAGKEKHKEKSTKTKKDQSEETKQGESEKKDKSSGQDDKAESEEIKEIKTRTYGSKESDGYYYFPQGTMASGAPEGYHLEYVDTITCTHNVTNANGSFSCNLEKLTPTTAELKNLKNYSYNGIGTPSLDVGSHTPVGTNKDNVAALHSIVNISGISEKTFAAKPYECASDHYRDGNSCGYAGYVYYSYKFSKCSHDGSLYKVETVQKWQHCTRPGIDPVRNIGVSTESYSHNFDRYKEVPNGYTVRYTGTGATGGYMADSSHAFNVASPLSPNQYVRRLQVNYDKGCNDATAFVERNSDILNAQFDKWVTSDYRATYSDGQWVTNLTTVPNGVVELLSLWKSVGTVLPSGTREGYDLVGWKTSSPRNIKPNLTYEQFQKKNEEWSANITKLSLVWDEKPDRKNPYETLSQEKKKLYKSMSLEELYNLMSPKDLYDWYIRGTYRPWMNSECIHDAGTPMWIFGNGEEVNFSAVWKIKQYKIKYDANGGTGTMEDGIKTHFKPYTIAKNAFIREGYDFVEWNTKPDGSGDSYNYDDPDPKKRIYKTEAPLTLYAQWKIHFKVAYIGNEQTKGEDFIDGGEKDLGHSESLDYAFDENMEQTETEPEDHFQRTDTIEAYTDEETGEKVTQEIQGTVVEWNLNPDNDKTRLYELGGTISGEELVTDAKDYDNATVGSPNGDYGKKNNLVAKAQGSVLGSKASGTTLQTGVKAAYDNIPFTFVNLYAVWDMGPVIEAYDRYYTIEEAQSGFITEEELLNAAKATDQELKSKTNEEGRLKNFADEKKHTSFVVYDYKEEEFKNLSGSAVISVTYRAEDAVGNVTRKMIFVHIVDGHDTVADGYDLGREADAGKVRFISEKYLDTLDEDSVWVNNPEYRAALEHTLSYQRINPEQSDPVPLLGDNYTIDIPGTGEWNKKPQSVWTFTREQVKEAQQFVEDHGPSNYKEEDGLEKFYEKFKGCRKEP